MWVGPPVLAVGIGMAWIAYSMDGTAFGDTLVVYREDGRDVQTVPIHHAFDMGAERLGFPVLELSRVIAEFQPQFVDAVRAEGPGQQSFLLVGLASAEGGIERKISIVQSRHTGIPVPPSVPGELIVKGARVWSQPSPLHLDGQVYHQYLFRTEETEVRISFAQTDKPTESVVRELVESMLDD